MRQSPLRDPSDPALIIAPVEVEPEHIDVIRGGLIHVGYRNLWNSHGKR